MDGRSVQSSLVQHHYLDQDKADDDDMQLRKAIAIGVVPKGCQQGGYSVLGHHISGIHPCESCPGPRKPDAAGNTGYAKCGGKPPVLSVQPAHRDREKKTPEIDGRKLRELERIGIDGSEVVQRQQQRAVVRQMLTMECARAALEQQPIEEE